MTYEFNYNTAKPASWNKMSDRLAMFANNKIQTSQSLNNNPVIKNSGVKNNVFLQSNN